ncbi:uncharacterized protein N0V89_007237 [Didymosphaeria variabile]|uniref:Uncharacterized protein n=1 Tax=Didymosphaeria variabile TaxID=1932322 RepID=A0A9W9CA21_9PLEO|nr:uncharacterized protein N0V89_007237 [Didymosphaeria variabile]KAJ4351893.1 hypothetical protein N0V89_007237 [Didymosphaeria variabile]
MSNTSAAPAPTRARSNLDPGDMVDELLLNAWALREHREQFVAWGGSTDSEYYRLLCERFHALVKEAQDGVRRCARVYAQQQQGRGAGYVFTFPRMAPDGNRLHEAIRTVTVDITTREVNVGLADTEEWHCLKKTLAEHIRWNGERARYDVGLSLRCARQSALEEALQVSHQDLADGRRSTTMR